MLIEFDFSLQTKVYGDSWERIEVPIEIKEEFDNRLFECLKDISGVTFKSY
jgi:hypothetical protein